MSDKKGFIWPLKVLQWFCPDHLYEEISGDLLQRFERDQKDFGLARAQRRLIWNAIRFFRPAILLRAEISSRPGMLNYHIRSGMRHLGRQRLTTGLHVAGLTLGLSVCFLIILFIRHELSFDNHHENADRIYRINSVWTDHPQKFHLYATPVVLADELRSTIPGLEKVALVRAHYPTIVELNPGRILKQDRVLIAEPEFLDIFKIEVLKGEGKEALKKPYQAMLTQSTARKFYGDEEPLGKTFKYKNKFMVTVAGVIRDMPSNTSLPASMLLSYVPDDAFLDNGDISHFGHIPWTKLSAMIFVVPAKNLDLVDFQRQLTRIADAKINSSPEVEKNIRGDFRIQQLKEIHFDTNNFGGGPWVAAVNSSWLWIFGGIGLSVLVLACVNFLNLSTAQAITRGKEVGIRKSIGAGRSQLVGQFLTEAGILTTLSGVLSVIVVAIVLNPVSNLSGRELQVDASEIPMLICVFFSVVVTASMLAGIYPAFVISRFSPLILVKSNAVQVGSGAWLRKGLVIVQFTISTSLMLVVLVVTRQVDFMRNKDLGFDKENILTVELADRKMAQVFANEIVQIPGVMQTSFTRSSPISNDHWWNGMSLTKGSEGKTVCAIYGDEHYCSLFGLKLLSGRVPANNVSQATNQVVVNEMLLEDLGLGTPAEAIGKHFWWGGDTEIAGVVANFNAEPLHYEMRPTLIAQDTSVYDHLSIKLQAGVATTSTLSEIENYWRKAFPNGVYEFRFVDQEVNGFYQLETRLNKLFRFFAAIAILISCLGLWGLVTFISQRRTKEVGIRKVLGASVANIFAIISREFIFLTITAFAIGAFLSFFTVDLVLKNFAYKTSIGMEVYLVTGASMIGIALFTVSFQTLKVARTNPVQTLKSE